MLSKEITEILRDEARVYETAIIKTLKAKLARIGYNTKDMGEEEIIKLILGITGGSATRARYNAEANIKILREEGGKGLELSSARKKIIKNLDKMKDDPTTDQRRSGVYWEQIGFDYAQEVIEDLFSTLNNQRGRKFAKVKDGNNLNYDWSIQFGKYNDINTLTEEERELMRSGIKIEHKSGDLTSFHIGDGTIDRSYIEKWTEDREIDMYEDSSLDELVKSYILLTKFNNNYPIFFSVGSKNFLLSSEILNSPNSLYTKNVQPSVDIDSEAKEMYLDSVSMAGEDEMAVYIEAVKTNKSLYNEFKKDVIQRTLTTKKVKGSLWYGKK